MTTRRAPFDKGANDNGDGRPYVRDRFVALFSGLAKSKGRRYIIEVKDAQSGAVVMCAAVDWTKTQKRAGIGKICRVAGLPHDKDFTEFRTR
jgi:hypothetical protein